jgi:hypothetical protein
VRVLAGRGWTFAALMVPLVVTLAGCGPCASLGGRHNVTIFERDDNAAEFQTCADTGNCLALCKLELNPTGESSLIVDECRRLDADAGAGADAITVAIRYHVSTCS